MDAAGLGGCARYGWMNAALMLLNTVKADSNLRDEPGIDATSSCCNVWV